MIISLNLKKTPFYRPFPLSLSVFFSSFLFNKKLSFPYMLSLICLYSFSFMSPSLGCWPHHFTKTSIVMVTDDFHGANPNCPLLVIILPEESSWLCSLPWCIFSLDFHASLSFFSLPLLTNPFWILLLGFSLEKPTSKQSSIPRLSPRIILFPVSVHYFYYLFSSFKYHLFTDQSQFVPLVVTSILNSRLYI